ncbi:MAG: hypothetical protein UT30_C0008G0032 [Candidatus Uhrbacteria bacterium GW2011_GWF2_39_13]|uniref:Uncharacterized protein n=1 Tax=Candidatus Uhrbacteria bacterium GW2011_GWF2_39_13 TaxID=1618995 RepID=A0A0G0Q1U4_9BACT|nr:MAG: hypothetical protein UT30_C0008G0032 [Candidatus Uhrbacteria bacterium GW2011_GWF2_39_13]
MKNRDIRNFKYPECPFEIIKYRFFTLVELMIVITIILILAGLLLPALKNAKSMSQSILCKGNLKQIGIAMTGYVSDYNEKLMWSGTPYVSAATGNGSIRPWYELLGIFGPYSILDYGVRIASLATKNERYGKNMLCPNQNISDKTLFSYADYACNRWFFGVRTQTDTYKNHSVEMMQKPSQVILVADNGYDSNYSVSMGWFSGNTAYDGYCIRSNHIKSANILFGDMHVNGMKREDIGNGSSILRSGFDSFSGYE